MNGPRRKVWGACVRPSAVLPSPGPQGRSMSTQQAMQRVRSAVRRPTVAERTASTTVAFAGPSTRDGWRRALRLGMIAYVIPRLCAIAGAAVVAAQVRVADSADRAEALANGEVLDKPPLPGG